MGADPWSYFTPYEPHVAAALAKLRRRVFESGQFEGSELQPSTPEEAFENMEEVGTSSILDISQIGSTPEFCTACPLPDAKLTKYFSTAQPTHDQVAATIQYYEEIDRGQAIYVVVYQDGKPAEYFFAGYSFD